MSTVPYFFLVKKLMDDEGKALEIERLREMAKEELLSSEHIKEIEEGNEVHFVDAVDEHVLIAKVFFNFRYAKWQTLVFHEPTGEEPIHENFVHYVRNKRGILEPVFDKLNFGRAMDRYRKSGETILPLVPRPKKMKVKDKEQ